jgi:NhaP-type Na+/H+ or K+/H+ antiporter
MRHGQTTKLSPGLRLNDRSFLLDIGNSMKELETLLVVIGLAVLVGFVLGYGVRAYISKRRRRRARNRR